MAGERESMLHLQANSTSNSCFCSFVVDLSYIWNVILHLSFDVASRCSEPSSVKKSRACMITVRYFAVMNSTLPVLSSQKIRRGSYFPPHGSTYLKAAEDFICTYLESDEHVSVRRLKPETQLTAMLSCWSCSCSWHHTRRDKLST